VATPNPIEVAADIVVAFVSHNPLPISELSALIQSVHEAITGFGERGEVAAAVVDPRPPAVSIRKSVMPDYLICLDDGKRFKSLRRHLALLGMTPEQYRAKWRLPSNYPMVAPSYAAQRSAIAKKTGLGQMRKKSVAEKTTTGTKAKGEKEPGFLQSPAKRKPGRPRQVSA
jgi:predicted transcriptional regulator